MEYFKLPKKIKRVKHSLFLWKREIETTNWNKFSRESTIAVQKYFNPTEHEISSAPTVSTGIIAKLAFSLCLDFIGFATFFIPIFGWLFNLLWAPFSSFCVHKLYTNNFFTTLNFVEELLPVVDVVPTATLAWIYTYDPYFNVWIIRVCRTLWTRLSRYQRVKDLKVKFEDFVEKTGQQASQYTEKTDNTENSENLKSKKTDNMTKMTNSKNKQQEGDAQKPNNKQNGQKSSEQRNTTNLSETKKTSKVNGENEPEMETETETDDEKEEKGNEKWNQVKKDENMKKGTGMTQRKEIPHEHVDNLKQRFETKEDDYKNK